MILLATDLRDEGPKRQCEANISQNRTDCERAVIQRHNGSISTQRSLGKPCTREIAFLCSIRHIICRIIVEGSPSKLEILLKASEPQSRSIRPRAPHCLAKSLPLQCFRGPDILSSLENRPIQSRSSAWCRLHRFMYKLWLPF